MSSELRKYRELFLPDKLEERIKLMKEYDGRTILVRDDSIELSGYELQGLLHIPVRSNKYYFLLGDMGKPGRPLSYSKILSIKVSVPIQKGPKDLNCLDSEIEIKPIKKITRPKKRKNRGNYRKSS
jgi:hypothetical protein